MYVIFFKPTKQIVKIKDRYGGGMLEEALDFILAIKVFAFLYLCRVWEHKKGDSAHTS